MLSIQTSGESHNSQSTRMTIALVEVPSACCEISLHETSTEKMYHVFVFYEEVFPKMNRSMFFITDLRLGNEL